jgi:hypothetical protein
MVRKITRKAVEAATGLCKKLQFNFGCWRGTVAHRRLFPQLEAMPVATRDKNIAEAVDRPRSAIRARGAACPDSAMETHAEEPDLGQAEQGRESSWDRR